MTTTCCRDCSDITKQMLDTRFQLAPKAWRVMATSLPCLIKLAAPELRRSAIKFAPPKVDPLLLPALLGRPARRLPLRLLRINLRYRGGLLAARRLLVRGD